MWPALAMALLVAAVWYVAGSSGAQAQSATPEVNISPEWQWMGDTVTLSASGFTPGVRAWAHVSWSPDEVPTCRDVSVVENQVGDDLVADDGTVSFALTVAPPRFQAGDNNYLCAVDREGGGIDLRPERLRVVEPPPVYRMRLDVTAIEQAPDGAYSGTEPMPHNFAVVDGRHSDNWNLPQRRGFFPSAQPGSGNADYGIDGVDSAGSGLVVVPAGDTEATIPVRILDDNIVESGLPETVVAELADLDAYEVSSGDGTHTLHIQDNDALHVGTNVRPLVTFAQISQRVGEDVGSRDVTVNLSPAPAGDMTILYQVSGTAQEGDAADFTISNSGSLSVAANSSSVSIPVVVRNDADDEADETVVLLLKSAGAYHVGNTPQHTLTISDNDDPLPVLTVAASRTRVDMDPVAGASVDFTVRSDRALVADLQVNFDGGFYSLLEPGALTIPAADSSAVYTVKLPPDSDDLPDLEWKFELTSGAGYSLGTPSSVSVTVRDTQPTVVSMARTDTGGVMEGSDVEFSVSLGRALAEGEVVDVPLRASGVSPSDVDTLSLVSGTGVTIRGSGLSPVVRFQGAGARTASLEWHVRTDAMVEASGETMKVEIQSGGSGTNVSGGTSLHAENRSFDVTVSDLSAGDPVITVLAQSNTVTEGGNAVFRIVADPAPAADLVVTLNVVDVAGSDFLGQDVEGSRNTVTVKAASTAATFSFATLADQNDEPSGDVEVQVVAGSGYRRGSSDRVRVADDDATRVSLSVDGVTDGVLDEGASDGADLVVTLERALERGESLAVRLALSGEVTTADYELSCGTSGGIVCSGLDGSQPTLAFTGPMARVGVVKFTALGDGAVVERDLESVVVAMSLPSSSGLDGGASPANSRVSFSVRDRNPGVPTVSFDRSEFHVMEDVGTHALRLTLSKPLDEDLLVGYTLSGTAMRDFSSASVQGKLVDTDGQWYRCEERQAGGAQLGCSWDQRPDGNTSEDEVYLARVPEDAPEVKVPGDTVELRLALKGADLGVRKAAERYVVFWGPVDIWLLGGTGLGGPQDFVIQSEHLAGLRSRPVLENELDENGVFTLSLDRGSANFRGDTFVAVVPCNDDYLEGKFSGAEFDRVQLALRDCNEPAVEGLPPLAGAELIPPAPQDAGARERSFYGGVTRAWSQHNPRSGLGLACDVEITSRDDDSGGTTFYRTIRCENSLDEQVTRDDYNACMSVLRDTGIDAGVGLRRIKCGMGHYDRPADRFLGGEVVWGTTRYNAARSFYGFVLNWQRGGGGGTGRPGCDVDLLPYRVVEGAEGEPVRHVGLTGAGAREWLTGEVGGDADFDCVAGPGVDELDVVFYTPKAGTDEDSPPWTEFEQGWHNSHPVHFAVYVSGMASEYADSGDVVNGEDDPFPAGWRRVSLGSWEVAESDPYRRARGFTTLGLWYPHSDRLPPASGGVRFPLMEEVSGGKRLTVPRDFAGPDGVVRLFVVPCLPLYSGDTPVQGACEDLPVRVGPLEEARFDLQSARIGPFGFVRDNSLIRYSRGVTVIFRTGAWDDVASRPVSWPARVHEPSEGCGVESVLPSVGSPADVYWREVTVQGGACDRSDLSLVPVRLSNVSGAASDQLVVYVTGGRTDRLDKVRMERAGPDPSSYGRLGLRERELTIAGGASETLHISPDLANREDEVWLVAYSCGSAASHGGEKCPRVRRNRDTVVYDVSVPPAFVVRVRFTPVAQLKHTELAPVCQGADCDIKVGKDVPVLREAVPDAPDGACGASSYPAAPSGGLIYWPDRLVSGGACAPDGLADVEVAFHNATDVGGQRLVVYATGGRGPGLERIQVKRAGEPAGRAGLRRVEFTLSSGGTGRVLVSSDLADEHGRILLLAYLCSDAENCLDGAGNDGVTFAVDRRPLFQVLVDYDEGFLTDSGLSICRGDRCSETYPLGTVSHPSGDGCGVSASYSAGRVYWPGSVVAEGGCDRDTLVDVPVTFSVPASAVSSESLTVYVTGGRSRGLDEVKVKRAPATPSTDAGALDYLVEYPFDLAPYSLDVSSGLANVAPLSSLMEAHNTQNMRWLHSAHPDFYSELEAKSWVRDGLDAVEKRGLDALLRVAVMEPETAEAAERIAAMPFLETFDELDYLTLWGLAVAVFRGSAGADVSRIYDILDHSRFLRGVSDADRLLVMGASTMSDRGRVKARLTQGYPVVDPLERSGYTVTVVRPAAGEHSYVLGHLAGSVAAVQREMGIPFPVRNVVLYMDDDMVLEDAAGVNYGYAISAHTKYEQAEGTRKARQLKSTIIHEVAHYYWRDARPWINEGLASAFEVMVGPELGLGEDVTINKKESGNLKCDLPNLRSVVREDPRHYCNYYLGQRLFLALRDELGPSGFGDALRALYERLQDCRDRGGSRPCATIDDVRAAFPLSVRSLIDAHWGTVAVESPTGDSDHLGRLGVREVFLTVAPGAVVSVRINPDLAGENGEVWLFAYRCDLTHGDSGCPLVERPVVNGYDLPKGPDFAVRVTFTEESGLTPADLQEVCRGQQCDIAHPWLRRAEPDIGECGARLGIYWPDRVIRGGDCYIRGSNYGPVVFKSDAAEKFVVYTTGDGRRELDLVQVHGVLGDGGDDAANDSGKPLGKHGLRESLVELAAGGEERAWVRADMADDDGNVWLFAYRCLADHGDAGCPLVDRDQVRPSYDVPVRPAFVVRVSFVSGADADRSTLEAHCSTITGTCELTATFRDAAGTTLPGTVEFRVDRGALGQTGSTAQVSRKRHLEDATGNHQFKETLILPTDGGMVNVEAELLGDGTVLTRRVGHARNVARLSADVMRCSDDEKSCHAGGLTRAERLLAGDHFVLVVTGYDASGDVALPVTRLGEADCRAGRPGAWPTFQLDSVFLRSYGYGASQPPDRGYAGCAIQVSENASVGTHGITVSYRGGAGAPVTTRVQVVVGVDTSKLGYLLLSGPSQLESGKSDTYRVVGLNLERLRMGYDLDGGCLKLNLSGALEGGEGGSASSGCISDGLPKSGVEFTVQAKEDVVYQTDSSVGVSYGDIKVSNHVMVIPAEDDAGAPVPATSSHISNLTISQEGGQLSVTWNSSPQADFKSLRAQVWVTVGGEDVFLPGCQGGEVHAVDTQQVFCLLSYGQSEDVYHAAVGFIRYDNSAVPVETTQWTRP